MIYCNQSDKNGYCPAKGGKCEAALPHSLSKALGHRWLDKITGEYVCRLDGWPVNSEDNDLAPHKEEE